MTQLRRCLLVPALLLTFGLSGCVYGPAYPAYTYPAYAYYGPTVTVSPVFVGGAWWGRGCCWGGWWHGGGWGWHGGWR